MKDTGSKTHGQRSEHAANRRPWPWNVTIAACLLACWAVSLAVTCRPSKPDHPKGAASRMDGERAQERNRAKERKARTEKMAKKIVSLPKRSEIAEELKWNPSVIFESRKAWEQEQKRLLEDIPKLETCKGKLGLSAEKLKECLDRIYEVQHRLERLQAYASRIYDTDIRQSRPQAMTAQAQKLFSDFLSATAYVEPELLALPEKKLRAWAKNPKLADYDREIIRLIRLKEHVLTKPEEKVLAEGSIMGLSAYRIYKTFANADMEFPTFTDHEGREVRLSASTYAKYRKSPHREERKEVFQKFWSTYKSYRNSFSQMLSTQMQYYDYVARVRKYDDALSYALLPDAIPPEFYPKLIKQVTSHLDVFHKYLRLRKRLLGIEGDQYYYDIYPLVVSKSAKKYTYQQARDIIPTALQPLGKSYMEGLRSALAKGSGWLDVYPNLGKRSGAYSSSVYGAHPLVLLNYTDDFNSLSTTAHELGHALHSWYSQKSQPYAKADYSLFVAEVASIFNETLLIEHLLRKEKDPAQRKFLLSAYLDSFRGTVFRQTMFAEFEREAYKRLAARKPVTAESLSKLYLKLLRKYHGHDKGVMNIEPLYGVEWAYIPHFYYHFYVYQYVSGFVAATALAEKVAREGTPAAKRYIKNLLEAGSSKDPIEILKDAGVDMMSPKPYALAADKFAKRVAELEKLAGE